MTLGLIEGRQFTLQGKFILLRAFAPELSFSHVQAKNMNLFPFDAFEYFCKYNIPTITTLKIIRSDRTLPPIPGIARTHLET